VSFDDEIEQSPDVTLVTFDRSSREKPNCEQLRLQVREYQGKRYVDVRAYYRPDADSEWRPTKKGITIRAKELDAAIDALTQARELLG
jgi:hypothetical protein